MNSKIVYIVILVGALVACVAFAVEQQTPNDVKNAATEIAPTPDCPVRRTVQYMSNWMDRVKNLGGSVVSPTEG